MKVHELVLKLSKYDPEMSIRVEDITDEDIEIKLEIKDVIIAERDSNKDEVLIQAEDV